MFLNARVFLLETETSIGSCVGALDSPLQLEHTCLCGQGAWLAVAQRRCHGYVRAALVAKKEDFDVMRNFIIY